MKRSEKQFPSKANFSIFWNLIALNFGKNCVKGLIVTKIVKEIKFEGVWDKLKGKKNVSKDNHPQNI